MIIDKIVIFRYITIILDAVIAIYTQLTNNKVIFIEIIRLTICKPEGSDGKEVESFKFSFSWVVSCTCCPVGYIYLSQFTLSIILIF